MLYSKVDCPHCGNEITVNNTRETQKCRWCRRLISVKFDKPKKNGKKIKIRCRVEVVDFPETQNLNEWTDEDIYGHK